MKCPHCTVAIHDSLSLTQTSTEPGALINGVQVSQRQWYFLHQRCPQCYESIVYLYRAVDGYPQARFLAFPQSSTRPLAPEVVDPYRQDFIEACTVLPFSPKASAALSRRCLQAVLKDKAGA